MAELDVSPSTFERIYADLPPAALLNRFFEQNPFQGGKKAAIGRPATTPLGNWGTGPIRKIYSEPGIFSDALFFVSGDTLYRRDLDGTTYPITGVIYGSGEVSMASVKGLDYQRLFIADGNRLQFYAGGTQGTAVLGFTPVSGTVDVAAGDTVEVNGTYYEFETPVSGVVTGGTGASASPFKVAIAGTFAGSFGNLVKAISFTGTSGVDYSSTIGGQNDEVTAQLNSAQTEVTFTTVIDTAAANAYTFSVGPSGTDLTASGATFTGANNHGLSGVEIPEGYPPSQVAVLKSFVVVAIGRTDRFYWVEPGEVTIEALNFATAESYPDNIVSLQVMQDTLWFIGQKSTEIWYATGNADLPFNPVSGRVYDRGALEGTVVNIKGTLYLVDQDYIVYAIAGQPKRISNHGIEETIRKRVALET
jgi:hypothetical protein